MKRGKYQLMGVRFRNTSLNFLGMKLRHSVMRL